jgi:hypothetical protein
MMRWLALGTTGIGLAVLAIVVVLLLVGCRGAVEGAIDGARHDLRCLERGC